MFKGFQNKSRQFNGFPNLNFQVNNEAYGFSGCTFWLDAAYGTNTQTNLAAITTWQSKIQQIICTQTTAANQPRFILSDPSFNNLPVVDFSVDGVRNLNINTSIGLAKNGFSMFFVIQTITQQSTSLQVILNNTSTNLYNVCVGGTALTGFGVDNQLESNIKDVNKHIFCLTSSQIVADGVQVATGTYNTYTAFNRIGHNTQNSAVHSCWSKIAEIVIFNREFDTNDLIKISDLLNSKYAIY